MLKQSAVLASLSVAFLQVPALAQGTSSGNTSTSPSTTTNQPSTQQPLSQRMKQKLESQGFTDVQVVPESLLVSAKDKDGDPVTMVISPNSMTVFTTSNVSATTNGPQSPRQNSGTQGSGTQK